MLAVQLRIPLTNGGSAIIDITDAYLAEYSWCRGQSTGKPPYVYRTNWRDGDPLPRELHRAVMRPSPGQLIDHKSGNTFDNRRSNLRVTTQQENARNITGNRKNSASRVLGVTYHKKSGKWQASITHDHKLVYLGIYDDIDDARRARAVAERRLWGVQPRRAEELDVYAPV